MKDGRYLNEHNSSELIRACNIKKNSIKPNQTLKCFGVCTESIPVIQSLRKVLYR